MSADIHRGRDGWLFLSGGSNEVLNYYTQPNFFESAAEGWLALLCRRKQQSEQLGILYRHMIVPDKLSIYPEYYLEELPLRDEAPSASLAEKLKRAGRTDLSALLVDARASLLRDKQADRLLYWKTDSHWTFDGAYAAYNAYCETVNANPNQAVLESPAISGELFLDFGAKLDPPVSERYITRLFLARAKRTVANCIVEYKEANNAHGEGGLHVGSHVVYRNEEAEDPRIVCLFGDSYSEYREHQLTGLLAETFREVHFIWSSSIDWGYVRRVRPQLILTEMAERFSNLVPSDDLDIDSFARSRLDRYLSEKG